MSDAHTCMMPQDTKGISFSVNEETLAFTILVFVNNILKTWHRRNASFGIIPTSADQDFASRNLRAKVHRAMCEDGGKWTPPDKTAGAPAGVSDRAEKLDVFTSNSGSAAHGAGVAVVGAEPLMAQVGVGIELHQHQFGMLLGDGGHCS